MRFHHSAVAAIALASALASTVASTLPASAADYPVLRGTSSPSLPPAPMIHEDASPWEGFYIGGLAGMNSLSFDPKTGAADLVRTVLRNSSVETVNNASRLLQPAPFSARGASYGAFLGYNMQFQDVVIGFEGDYQRINKGGSSTNAIARQFPNVNNFIEAVDLTGSTTARLDHFGSLRVRAGYVMGNIMPYLTGGMALGYGTVTNTALVSVEGVVPDPVGTPGGLPYNITYPPLSSTQKNAFMIGLSGGAGVEALFGGLILRGEYLFSRLQAQGGVVIDVNQARFGAGVKF